MKTIVLASAIAAVLASPALAASPTTPHHAVRHDRQLNHSNALMQSDPIGVYVDGREVGRDPDPNIRSEIEREYYRLQGE